MINKVKILDCTLRDGGYVNDWQFGDDNAKEILGSDNISEIDLSEVTLTAKKIIDAYDKPITDYDLEKSMRKIEGIPIDKIVSVANAAEKIVKMPQQK